MKIPAAFAKRGFTSFAICFIVVVSEGRGRGRLRSDVCHVHGRARLSARERASPDGVGDGNGRPQGQCAAQAGCQTCVLSGRDAFIIRPIVAIGSSKFSLKKSSLDWAGGAFSFGADFSSGIMPMEPAASGSTATSVNPRGSISSLEWSVR